MNTARTDAVEKAKTARYIYRFTQTGPECLYCGVAVRFPRISKYCCFCGTEDSKTSFVREGFGAECADQHFLLKQTLRMDPTAPFCEDCGFCGLPATWREHKCSPNRDLTSYELVVDGKQVASIWFPLDDNGQLDPKCMSLCLEPTMTVDALYQHIQSTPNLAADAREILLAAKDRWDMSTANDDGSSRSISLKQ